MTDKKEHVLVVLGDGGVGKTSIILRYTRNQFSETYEPTLEDNHKATVMYNDQKINLDIADTAGQDDYQSLRSRYMDVGDAFLVVYSVAEPRTLLTAKERLSEIKLLKENNKFKFILVGNKCDIQQRAVPAEDGQGVADQFEGKFLETSAKTNVNIQECFQMIAQMLVGEPEKSEGGCCSIV